MVTKSSRSAQFTSPMKPMHSLLSAIFCHRVVPLLAAITLFGCSAGSDDPAGGASAGSGAAGNTMPVAGGGRSSVSNGNGSAGNSFVLDADAGLTPDDGTLAACARLNIGILGNPGSNGSSNFEQWLTKAGTSVKRIQTTAAEPLSAATLAPFDVVILDCLTRDYLPDEVTSFAAWVSTGGGVAAMSGYHDDTAIDWRANSLLAPLGVAFSGDRIWGPANSFAAHPITQGLTSVTFTGGYAVSDLGASSSTRNPIAFVSSNPPKSVAFAVQMGSGHAFVWGDEWIEFDSEWAALPEIPQLWVQAFAWIAPMTTCALNPPK